MDHWSGVDFRDSQQDALARNLQVPDRWPIESLSWAADGNAVFVGSAYFIARITMEGKTRVLLDPGRKKWLGTPCPSPDGRYLAFSQQTFESNLWLLENIQ